MSADEPRMMRVMDLAQHMVDYPQARPRLWINGHEHGVIAKIDTTSLPDIEILSDRTWFKYNANETVEVSFG